ncbi:MAG: hypothetical protein AAF581_16355 [Planctomycetota bacterium]
MRMWACGVLTGCCCFLAVLCGAVAEAAPGEAAALQQESAPVWRVGDSVWVGAGSERIAGKIRKVNAERVTVATESGRIVVAPTALTAVAPQAGVAEPGASVVLQHGLPPRHPLGGAQPVVDPGVLLQSSDQLSKSELEYLGRPWGEVVPIETRHYFVMCNSTEEVAQRYANMLEALFRKYNEVFKNFNPTQTEKSKVWIHANHQQFMDWTNSPPGVGGFYRLFNRDVTAYHGSFGSTGTTYEVLAHEGTHQFQGFTVQDFNAMPRWLAEGLAVFFGDGSELKGFGKSLEVEIGKIPRDRLLTLQSLMKNTDLWKPETFMLWGPNYPGIGYAPAWGIIYWCLWGNQKVKGQEKAYSGSSGPTILKEFFEPITQAEGMVDLRAELDRFKQLIVEHTKHSSYEEWRDEYRDWIMTLKVDQLFTRRGTMWVSEAIGCEVPRVSGWGKVPPEDSYGNQEAIAFQKRGSQMRRIATWFWPNSNRDKLSTKLVKAIHEGSFKINQSHFEEASMEGVKDDFLVHATEDGTVTHLEARFTGKVGRRRDALSDGGEDQQPEEDTGPREIWVIYRATLEKIYANILEVDKSAFSSVENTFERYDQRFKIR